MQVMADENRLSTPDYLGSRPYKKLYSFILGLSFLWCGLLFAAPLLADGSAFSRKIAAVITIFYAPICHQTVERSFQIIGHPLAVCSRCTGIYLGFLGGVIIYPFLRGWKKHTPPVRSLLVILIIPSLVDFLFFRRGISDVHLFLRALTGIILGGGIAFFVIPALFSLIKIRKKS